MYAFEKKKIDDKEKFCIVIESGHGGARAAEYVKQNLFSNLIRHPKFISDTKSAIGLALLPVASDLMIAFLLFLKKLTVCKIKFPSFLS